MDNKKYFSWQNLNEIAEINRHIEFAEQIIKKYEWDSTVQCKFENLLRQIKKKQNDDKLNLSVIGEFSTGKSTFINALLRMDLLTACVIQGTTTAATIIEYDEKFKITLHNDNGSIKNLNFSSLDALRETLDRYTTDESLSKHLKYIYVYLPSPVLALGYRIIDTPGTNSTQRWHEDVTINTIKEMSDASVVLSSMEQLFPQTTLNFVKTYLSDILNQCIFIGTKFDVIQKGERERMLKYMNGRVSQEFGLKNPMVFPYASIDVLDDFRGYKPEDNSLVKISHDTETKMFEFLAKQRSIIQAKKLISLINEMYDNISLQISASSQKYSDELNKLMRSKQADLHSFTERQTRERLTSFKQKAVSKCSNIENILLNDRKNNINEIMGRLNGDNLDYTSNYIDKELPTECMDKAGKTVGRIKREALSFNYYYKEEITAFQEEFKKFFRNLRLLEVSFAQKNLELKVPLDITVNNFSGAKNYINKKATQKDRLADVLIFVVLICFVIGIIFGLEVLEMEGLFGILIVSAVFAALPIYLLKKYKKSKTYENNVKNTEKVITENVRPSLEEYFDKINDDCIRTMKNHVNHFEKMLADEIDMYKAEYQKIVDEQIKKQKAKKAELESKIQKSQYDMQLLQNRQSALNSISRQLERVSK